MNGKYPIQFGTFTHKEFVTEGTCENWNEFRIFGLLLPDDSYYISSLVLQTANSLSGPENVTCDDPFQVKYLVNAIRTGYRSYSKCNGHEWRVFQCNGLVTMCVNCVNQECSLCPGTPNRMNVKPCATKCRTDTTAFSVLSFGVTKAVLYPKLTSLSPTYVSNTSTSVTFQQSISSSGYIYSIAKPESQPLHSIYEMINDGVSVLCDTTLSGTLKITNLQPETKYIIYLYTEDFLGHRMDFGEVLTTATNFTTPCCRQLLFPDNYFRITESNTEIDLFSLTLNSQPTSICVVQLMASVDGMVNFYPSHLIEFGNQTRDLIRTFRIVGLYVGRVNITATPVNCSDIIENATFLLDITSPSTPPTPVKILNIRFSDSGNPKFNFYMYYYLYVFSNLFLYFTVILGVILYVSFASATDRMGKFSDFQCDNILSFFGSSSSTCFWINSTLLSVRLGELAIQELQVGSTVYLLKGVLRPYCDDRNGFMNCTLYPTNSHQEVPISPPLKPIAPVLSLLMPAMTYACNGLVIDASTSYGSAGKNWSSIKWTITGSESFTIPTLQQYFDLHFSSQDTWSYVNIPPNSTIFGSGLYTFTLSLQNKFGQSSTVSKNLVAALPNTIPLVQISGQAIQYVNRASQITLLARSSASICGLTISDNIVYTWQVYEGLQLQQNIISQSLDARFFKLSPFSLKAGSVYTVQVSVAQSSRPLAFSSAKVSIIVGVSGVVATIAGGKARTETASVGFSLDASASFDIDYPTNKSTLKFRWECYEYAPLFLKPCPAAFSLYPSPVNIISRDDIDVNKTTVYAFTVFVSNLLNVSGSSVVYITIVPELIATASISSMVTNKVSIRTKIVLQGRIIVPNMGRNISATGNISAAWTVLGSDVDVISAMALSPTSTTFLAPSTYSFPVAIAPNILSSGATYTFILSAYTHSDQDTFVASAQVVINVNSPPSGGILVVQPTNGTALKTIFQLVSSSWSDEPTDYPLTFMMYYYTSNSDIYTIIKSSSAAASAISMLGQGTPSMNYQVTCAVQVSDVYGDYGTTESRVTVNPLNVQTSQLLGLVNSTLSVLWKSNNVEAILTTASVASSLLTRVSCSNAQNCAERNREQCDNIADTCGVCRPGFIGAPGNANSICFSISGNSFNSTRKLSGEWTHYENQVTDKKLLAVPIKVPTPRPTRRPTAQPSILPTSMPTSIPSNNPSVKPSGQPSGQPSSAPSAEPYTEWMKLCPNFCSQRGKCVYYDGDENIIPTCLAKNFNCQARCTCFRGWYGSDCSKSADDISKAQKLNDILCSTFVTATARLDMSTSVLQDRTAFIQTILRDSTQLSSKSYTQCVSTFLKILKENLGFAIDISSHVYSTMSVILKSQFYQEALLEIIQEVSYLTHNLLSVEQSMMVVGEEDKVFLDPFGNDYLRTLIQNKPFGQLWNSEVKLPQTSLEILDFVAPETISVVNPRLSTTNRYDGVGMVVIQFSRNILRELQRNFSLVDVTYTLADKFWSLSANFSSIITTHPSHGIFNYGTGLEIPLPGTVFCPPSKSNVTANCPLGPVQVTCNGSPGVISYNCSAYLKVPKCAIYGNISPQATCSPISHSSDHISCKCNVVSNSSSATEKQSIRLPVYTAVVDYFTPFEYDFRVTMPTALPTSFPTANVHVIMYFHLAPFTASVLRSRILTSAMRSSLADVFRLPLYTIGTPVFDDSLSQVYIRGSLNTQLASGTNIRIDINSVLSLPDIVSRFNTTIFVDKFISEAIGKSFSYEPKQFS